MATTYEPEAEAPIRPSAPTRPAAPAKAKSSRRVFIIMGVVLFFLVLFGARKWWFGRSHVSTDNAQVDGHILPILPKVGGFVAEVRVIENQNVKAGDTLVVLDDRDLRARLQQTEADLAALLATVSSRTRVGQADAAVAQAQANVVKARADLARMEPLAIQNVVSQQQLDAARAAASAAEAQLASAQAALVGADARVAAARSARDQAALQLSYTRVIAPSGGVVSKKAVEVGQLVQPGQPLMTVVPLDDVWITANLKETESADVTPGDSATITVDAYKGRDFCGHVESLSPATGAKFSLLPPDNATGNYTKVVQRIPVRIRLDCSTVDAAHPLRPGMSAVATIKTH
ncbi:MAG TPA: HlyD family secretion protein [Gemmatimonadales bacterium]|nr:HlyD family secretion protein [Gemmatimonadales bacterium]